MPQEDRPSGITLPDHVSSRELDDDQYHAIHDSQRTRLGELQRKAHNLALPVVILFEGWYGSGISMMVRDLNRTLDPRGFSYHPIAAPGPLARDHHFLWRFWIRTPAKGRIAIFDRGWYARTILDRMDPRSESRVSGPHVDEILGFERALADSGVALVKIFLHISKKEQKQRLKGLKKDPLTMGYLEGDLDRYIKYREYHRLVEDLLTRTSTDFSPWHVIDAAEKKYTTVTVFDTITRRLEEAIGEPAKVNTHTGKLQINRGKNQSQKGSSALGGADLTLSLDRTEYDLRMNSLGKALAECQIRLYQEKIPLILVFEGWDAAGKGGNIMRVTRSLNPRGYAVMPVGPPDAGERAHHYLWRFFPALPARGHITIFDRSWYGRVLVERIEGLCTEDEWTRAYREIREFEGSLVKDGAIIRKFWLHIDRDEQLRRFREREADPSKQWKITEEDWRNRGRWDEYKEAVEQMIQCTSTPEAPWVVVEANDKYYSRVKTLQVIVDAIDRCLANRSCSPE
ncbi:MAG: Polyphosphate kinase 2 (PPK2) [Methanoregulaceae archaeon PtaU1.Bin059]|nr:MAG: Polyphosphate kinase 2 (PPK2) [Methanoregulaceae archaeon PtaB.Bin152]OPY41424.1 MAG: Polyphosphate kinase 2 (PPK2) [Methanoregulaceae archaeon PtaU1.Bin059]